ncbi:MULTISPECIES: NAD(P)/FAD-dependent oxidoreductase [Pacificimonas]|uniref:NAD(P)/FAD-dependent oxidoreductase n=1 Tax=Pacificimonas TaxID=1960290 RepID=UPI0037C82A04
MAAKFDVVIVGSGHAGAQAALALRQNKFAGTIALVGDELDPPYERPPLSKDYLAGEKPFERILLRKPEFWQERDIALFPGTRIETVDPNARTLTDADGNIMEYGDLIWATGGRPRTLPCGSDIGTAGVHAIRTKADVDQLVAELPQARKVVIIGGGYIGLEAAAVLVKTGREVTLVEAAPRILARVAGPDLSRFYEARHAREGVTLLVDTRTSCLKSVGGRVTGVELESGSELPADLVIVGIGIVPNVEPLLAAGAEGDNGVRVDGQCRTSLPHIYAVGDCALHENAFADGDAIRLESVQNANDQATVAAKVICGQEAVYEALPWFWSNQYDLKLQTAGLSAGHDDSVVRGDPAEGSFSVCYLKGGRLIAVDAVNRPKDFIQSQKLIKERRAVDRDRLADGSVLLKEL